MDYDLKTVLRNIRSIENNRGSQNEFFRELEAAAPINFAAVLDGAYFESPGSPVPVYDYAPGLTAAAKPFSHGWNPKAAWPMTNINWHVVSDQVHNILIALGTIVAALGFTNPVIGQAVGAIGAAVAVAGSVLSSFNVVATAASQAPPPSPTPAAGDAGIPASPAPIPPTPVAQT